MHAAHRSSAREEYRRSSKIADRIRSRTSSSREASIGARVGAAAAGMGAAPSAAAAEAAAEAPEANVASASMGSTGAAPDDDPGPRASSFSPCSLSSRASRRLRSSRVVNDPNNTSRGVTGTPPNANANASPTTTRVSSALLLLNATIPSSRAFASAQSHPPATRNPAASAARRAAPASASFITFSRRSTTRSDVRAPSSSVF